MLDEKTVTETVTRAEIVAASILPFCFAKHTATRHELHAALAKDIQRAINDALFEAKKLAPYDEKANYPTLYDRWINGVMGNFGGYQTKIFEAFVHADNDNRAKLASIYPDWFACKCESVR